MSAMPEAPSAPPGEAELETGRPSVTITRNAKGQAQWTVKVYGAGPDDADAASEAAQRIYDDLATKYGGTS